VETLGVFHLRQRKLRANWWQRTVAAQQRFLFGKKDKIIFGV
jgi:hypothetical protein